MSSLQSRLFGWRLPIPVPTGNSTSSVRLSTHLGDKWRAYDALPTPIREAVAQANVDLCPHNVGQAYRRVLDAATQVGLEQDIAIALYLEHFDLAQLGEIDLFSDGHPGFRGNPSPHVAARATRLTESTRPPPRPGRRRHRRAQIGGCCS